MDMVIQARPVFAKITRKLPVTSPQQVKLADQLDRILHGARARIRPKILRLILFHLA